MCLGAWFWYLSFSNIEIRSGLNLQCPAYNEDIRSHIYRCQLLGMCSLPLNKLELSYAQQFLSSQGMFEIDNYQSSLLELHSYLFCLSLSNRGFVSNYLYIFCENCFDSWSPFRFCGLERTYANPLVFNNLDHPTSIYLSST